MQQLLVIPIIGIIRGVIEGGDFMFCENCGTELNLNVRFCSNCGHKVKLEEDYKKEKIEELVNCLVSIKERKNKNEINIKKIPNKSISPTQSNDGLWGCLGCLGLIVVIIIIFTACTNSFDSDNFDSDSDLDYNEDSDYNSDGVNDGKDTYIEDRNQLDEE